MRCDPGYLLVVLLAGPVLAGESSGLLPPVQVQTAGKALDVERQGHAAPCIGDFYEDGSLCLLIGQFDGGRLRIYRNKGTRSRPRFDSYTWLEAGGQVASVPVG